MVSNEALGELCGATEQDAGKTEPFHMIGECHANVEFGDRK